MSSRATKPAHRVYAPGALPGPGEQLTLDDAEAHHAVNVKRVRAHDVVAVHDGRGRIAEATLEAIHSERRQTRALLRITGVIEHPLLVPEVEVWSAVPKGERAAQLVDQLSQVGAAAWRPLITSLGESGLSDAAMDRLRRVAVESMKQCARAWLMDIGEPAPLPDRTEPGVWMIMGDARGRPIQELELPAGCRRIRLLIGPEGGWTVQEATSLSAAGVRAVALGPHVMRIETAAVAGAAVVRLLGTPTP